jgi:hypothetical protein
MGMRIGGILYLHSIIANRLSGSVLSGLQLFKDIYGRDAYRGVVHLTMSWDLLEPGTRDWELAVSRQQQLETNPWAGILHGDGTALALVDPLTPNMVVEAMAREPQTLVLGIRIELSSEASLLTDMTAGKTLLKHYEEDKKANEGRILQTKESLKQAISEAHD